MAASRRVRVVLAVGGSDSSGGAGIGADVRTLESFGVAAATAVTAVTVQTGAQVRAVRRIPAALVADQMRAVLEVQPVRVIKCGMLGSAGVVRQVAAVIEEFGESSDIDLPVVVDPVAFATGGNSLGGPRVMREIRDLLIPLARVVTANLSEASALCGVKVVDEDSMIEAAREIVGLGAKAAVIKGGHLDGHPTDILFDGRRVRRFDKGPRYDRDMHGSGCAFASAVAAGLALGRTLPASVGDAATHVRALVGDAWKTADRGWLRSPVESCRVASRHRPRTGSSRRSR
jgi:hydroxymethylpyrimidine/phosphomethylpyrimidine kinase